MKINNNKLPKRKPKKTFRSVTGYFPSKKNGRSIFFESTLEKQYFLTLEFDKNVKSYLEQPIKLEYIFNNKKTRYHPDCLVHYIDNTSKLIEVKYISDLEENGDEYKARFDIAREYAKSNDMIFDIYTDKEHDTQTIRNMQFLYSFSTHPSDNEKEQTIVNILKSNKELSVTNVLKLITDNRFEQAKYLPYIWKLTFENTIKVDYEKIQINMNSQLRLNDE
jgi:hypothetical protein